MTALQSTLTNATRACVAAYAGRVSAAFPGTLEREWVAQRLEADLLSSHTPPPPTKQRPRLVLGVGPGSTGTRSLFVALTFLNIASVHFNVKFANCRIVRESRPTMELSRFVDKVSKTLDDDDHGSKWLFWTDTPVWWAWPSLLARFPDTKFV